MMKFCMMALVVAMAFVAQAKVGWRNLENENQVGGRKTSEGYLQGKVVMVYKDREQLPRMEVIWQGFKTKPFVMLGACGVKHPVCSFPQYAGAGLRDNEPSEPIYVVNAVGRVVYRGNDERLATEASVTALTDLSSPRSLDQWKIFLEFEFDNLPAHAYLRMAAFRQLFPAAAAEYGERVLELRAIKNIDKVAKFVKFAAEAKDMKDFGPKKKMASAKFAQSVRAALPKAKRLIQECNDERLAQEAKNALADLKWTAAAL